MGLDLGVLVTKEIIVYKWKSSEGTRTLSILNTEIFHQNLVNSEMRFSKNDSSEDKSDDAADSEALRLTWQCLLLTFPSSSRLPRLHVIQSSPAH